MDAREIAKEISEEGIVDGKHLDYYESLIEEYAYNKVMEERKSILVKIDLVKEDWREYGDQHKADACAYLLGYLDRTSLSR